MSPAAAKPIKTSGPVDATIVLPGSKSFTHRALICAALAGGESILSNALDAEDTRLTAGALTALGAGIDLRAGGARVNGTGGNLSLPSAPLMLDNSGTSMRLLTAVAALCRDGGEIVLDGNEAMRRRPIGALVRALNGLGVAARCRDDNFPPVTLPARGIKGGACTIDASQSSQFVSALLLAAPYAERDITVAVKGALVSRPYIDITIQTMADFGVRTEHMAEAEADGGEKFRVAHGQRYQPRAYRVEADASNASYFLAAAAATGGRVRAVGLGRASLQGDAAFINVLERMGCTVSREAEAVEATCQGRLSGLDIDMGGMPDVVPTLAVLAALAKGTTRIRNVGHLRVKECDRLSALATELGRCGVKVEAGPDELIIEGGAPHGAEIDTYGDHRMAMSFAVLGLAVPGITIRDPGCVAKSFPGFWERFETLYGAPGPECACARPAKGWGTAGKPSGAENGGRVVLIGYRCSGKTSIGRVLATRLGWSFVDTDAEVEREAGRSVAAIVEAEGWSGFRERERQAVKRLASADKVVIAVGGGAVLDPENRAELKRRARVVYLRCEPAAVAGRMAADTHTASQRPSLTGSDALAEIEQVMEEREPVYTEMADWRIEAGGRGIGELAAEIGRLIEGH
jgi:3-phosphoshikimate 1-carboxyvinyltransferase